MTRRSFMSSDKLRLSSSQAMLLMRILPLLVGEKVPESDCHWKCFLLLRRICEILLSPTMTEYLCATLKHLIEENHCSFLLYGDQIFTPKFHNS